MSVIKDNGRIYWRKNTVKAAILHEHNKPLIVEEIQLPGNLDYGQVLVKLECSTICGSQVGEISGDKGPDKYLPHLLGHEGCGKVIETGVGVTTVEKDDRVVLHWRKGYGINSPTPKYKWRGQTVGGGWVTTFNEYAVVSENRMTKIGGDIPGGIASLMGCAVTTALGLINNEAQLKIGQSIMIIGCGGVGLNIIQGAVMAGANEIIAVDKNEKKLRMASSFGADVNVMDLNNIRLKADVVVDCTGNEEMINIGYQLVKPGGRMILVGQSKYGEDITISNMNQHYCGKTLIDSQGGLTKPSIDIPRYLNIYRRGKLKLDSLITHRLSLDDINEGMDLVRSGEAGRVLIEMRDE